MPDLLVRSLLPACLSAPALPLLWQLLLLLGSGLCLDSVLRPPVCYARHPVGLNWAAETLLRLSPLLQLPGTSLTSATASLQLLLLSVPRGSRALSTTRWRASQDAIFGARACTRDMTRCVPPGNTLLFPSAIAVVRSPCMSGFLSLRRRLGTACSRPPLPQTEDLETGSRPQGKKKLKRKQTGQATEKQYRTRPQLALEMIQIASPVGFGLPETARPGDSEYAGSSISCLLPANAERIVPHDDEGRLFETPPAPAAGRGRRRKRPAFAQPPTDGARSGSVLDHIRWCGSMVARSRSVTSPPTRCIPAPGRDFLRIVVVRDPRGHRRDDCFFSTDPHAAAAADPRNLLLPCAGRWKCKLSAT